MLTLFNLSLTNPNQHSVRALGKVGLLALKGGSHPGTPPPTDDSSFRGPRLLG